MRLQDWKSYKIRIRPFSDIMHHIMYTLDELPLFTDHSNLLLCKEISDIIKIPLQVTNLE